MKAGSTPTIKDIARVVRLHYSSVSLALREHPSIPEATRARVRRVAQRLGYQRNPVMSALSGFRRGQTRALAPRLAYLVNRSREQHFDWLPHQQLLLEGARRQAEILGYELDLRFVTADPGSSRELATQLRETSTTGVLLGALEPGLPNPELPWAEYSVVKIDSRHLVPGVPVVSNDQLQVVRLAFQRLMASGYRRVGLAVGRGDEAGTDHRHTMGYFIEQAALPASLHVPPLLFPYNSESPGVAAMLAEWVRRERVEAVMCNWLNLVELLATSGLRVPQDVACACLCLLEPDPRLAGVITNLRVVGASAVSLLASLVRAGERGESEFATTTYVETLWQDGASAPDRR